MTACSVAILAMVLQDQQMDQHGTLTMGPGLTIVRNGAKLEAIGSVLIVPGDTVTVASSSTEKFSITCPDNSVITMMPGSALRVDRWGEREEYVLKGGSFKVFSCPHSAPHGHREVSLRTCCIRTWWPQQMTDVNFKVHVVGARRCKFDWQSGIVHQQEHSGNRMFGSVKVIHASPKR